MSSTLSDSRKDVGHSGKGTPKEDQINIPNKDSPVKLFDVILAEIPEENSPSTKPGELTKVEPLKTVAWDGTKPYTLQIRLQPKETQQVGPPPLTPQSPTPSETKNDIESILKRSVNNFVKNTNTLMSELYKVAKTRPVIKDILSYFKAGLELELAYRERDFKVIALNLTMCDMMLALVFTKLGKVIGPEVSDKDPLERFKKDIIDSITLCAKVCDSYRREQQVIAKPSTQLPFISHQWRKKFIEVAKQFADHKAQTLPSNTSLSIKTPTTLNAMQNDLRTLTESSERLMEVVFGSIEKDETGLNRDVEHAINGNKSFDKKFKAVVEVQREEVKMSITGRKTDRPEVDKQASGVEGIVDRDVYKVWKEQGWGDTVKAESLVKALYNHFKSNNLDTSSHDDADMLDQKTVKDMDKDLSASVTVSQVNEFTAARPNIWSLPVWILYCLWTCGSETTLQWYRDRINRAIEDPSNISDLQKTAISEFVNGQPMLGWARGARSGPEDVQVNKWKDFRWEDDHVFLNFKKYLRKNETRMEKFLYMLDHKFDAAKALVMVGGRVELEKYILPLILLLVNRARDVNVVMQAGSKDAGDLVGISDSLSILQVAVKDRVGELLRGKPQDQSEKDFLSKFCFGLYRNVEILSPSNRAS